MTNEELDDLVIPAKSESSDSEDKVPLTYKKLNKLLKKAQELSDFEMEIYPNEERRGYFMRGIEKLCTPYHETFKELHQSLSQAKIISFLKKLLYHVPTY